MRFSLINSSCQNLRPKQLSLPINWIASPSKTCSRCGMNPWSKIPRIVHSLQLINWYCCLINALTLIIMAKYLVGLLFILAAPFTLYFGYFFFIAAIAWILAFVIYCTFMDVNLKLKIAIIVLAVVAMRIFWIMN